MKLTKIFLFLTGFFATPSYGWLDTAHEMVATIALKELTPEAKENIDKLLKASVDLPGSKKLSSLTSDIVLASTWADVEKVSPLYKDSFAEDPYGSECHFFPLELEKSDLEKNKTENRSALHQHFRDRIQEVKKAHSKNIISCLQRTVEVLRGFRERNSDIILPEHALALRYLIHLVGDIHQPLHAFSMEGDQGGNKTKIVPKEISIHPHDDGPTSFKVVNFHIYLDATMGVFEQLWQNKFKTEDEEVPAAFKGHKKWALESVDDLEKVTSIQDVKDQVLSNKSEDIFDFDQWEMDGIEVGLNDLYSNLQLESTKKVFEKNSTNRINNGCSEEPEACSMYQKQDSGIPKVIKTYVIKTSKEFDQKLMARQIILAGVRLGRVLNAILGIPVN